MWSFNGKKVVDQRFHYIPVLKFYYDCFHLFLLLRYSRHFWFSLHWSALFSPTIVGCFHLNTKQHSHPLHMHIANLIIMKLATTHDDACVNMACPHKNYELQPTHMCALATLFVCWLRFHDSIRKQCAREYFQFNFVPGGEQREYIVYYNYLHVSSCNRQLSALSSRTVTILTLCPTLSTFAVLLSILYK